MSRPAAEAPKEIELRLLADAVVLDGLEKDELITAGTTGTVKKKHQVGTYFDTSDRRLKRRRVNFRVRQIGDAYQQTVKAAALDGSSPLTRLEWESPISGPDPDLAALASTGAGEVTGVLLPGDLEPLFVTDVHRTVRTIAYDTGGPNAALIEVAADRGEVRLAKGPANCPSTAISEFELELKAGPADALFDMALALNERHAVRVGFAGKADRGYSLVANAQPTARRTAKVLLQPSWTVDKAMQVVFQTCFNHWIANETAAESGTDPEGVHQLRVALRRLRSALTLLKPALSETDRAWLGTEVKWLATSLGPARDWDVFLGEMLPRVEAGGFAGQLTPLIRAAKTKQRAAYRQVREVIGSPRYTRLLLEFWRWLDGRGWRTAGLDVQSGPIVDLADIVLAKQHKRALKRGKGFEELTLPERHEVRIAVKKLRYSIAFFSSLYTPEQAKPYRKRLSNLQDALGAMNDVAMAEALLPNLMGGPSRAKSANAAALAKAAGILRGWYARGLIDEDADLVANWKAFRQTKPFWHQANKQAD